VLNAKLTYMPSCIRPEVRFPLDHNVFCAVFVVGRCIMASAGSLLAFCTAQKQDSFGAYDQIYTYVQPAVQTARCN